MDIPERDLSDEGKSGTTVRIITTPSPLGLTFYIIEPSGKTAFFHGFALPDEIRNSVDSDSDDNEDEEGEEDEGYATDFFIDP